MTVERSQYIPNPLVPQDEEGKALYLQSELNKIARYLAEDRQGDEGDIDPPDLPPTPDHQHWHDNLINVLPDQHHSQVHSHDSHTGIGEDDHHPKLHDVESHTDVTYEHTRLEGEALMWDEPNQRWENKAPRAESWPTGLINGGELNIGPGINDIEVVAGHGIIVDSYTNPDQQPYDVEVIWAQINTAITVTPVAGAVVYFTIDSTGSLQQWAESPTPQVKREQLTIGLAVHNGTEWGEISSPIVINNSVHTLDEFVTRVAGPSFIIEGGAISEAALHTLDLEAGTIWERNRNWHVDKKDPHREAFLAQTPLQFRYTNRDFSTVGPLTDTIDAANWDDAGVVTPIPGGSKETTIQRLYTDLRDNMWVMYGQETYASVDTAIALLGADTAIIEEPPLLAGAVLRGYIISQRNQTDWSFDLSRWYVASAAARSGGGGSPITDHDNLTGVTPNNHHNQVHPLFSSDHSDVDIATALTLRDGLFYNGSDLAPNRRVNWLGVYTSGPTYEIDDMAIEAGYLGICNTQTTEAIAPVAVGVPFNPLVGAAPSDDFQTSLVDVGNVFTFAAAAVIYELTIDVPPDNVGLPLTITSVVNGVVKSTTTFAPDAAGTLTLPISTLIVFATDVVEVHMRVTNTGGNAGVYWNEDVGYWGGYTNPLFSAVSGVKDSVGDTTAYGIGFTLVEATASQHWDVISAPGGASSSGGGSFTPDTFTGAGTSGYVPDPVTSTGQVLKDDGTWGAGGGGATESKVQQTAHGLSVLDCVRFNGVSWIKAQADAISTTALGVVVAVTDADSFTFAMSGRYALGALNADAWYYLSDTVAGGLTETEPLISQPIIYAEDGTTVVIYPYRPSYSIAPSTPIVGEVKAVTSIASLPFGWHLADGSNNTQDLRGRAIFGDGANGIVAGVSGGAVPSSGSTQAGGQHRHTTYTSSHALTADEMPSHTHNMFANGISNSPVGSSQYVAVGKTTTPQDYHMSTYSSTPSLGTTGFVGSGDSHTHAAMWSAYESSHTHPLTAGELPPYHGMYLIEYTGVA